MFRDGEDYEQTFLTPVGPVTMLAEVSVHGDVLWIKDFVVYPTEAEHLEVGVREVLKMTRSITTEALAQGFREVQVTGKRLSGAAPGRIISVMRRLR